MKEREVLPPGKLPAHLLSRLLGRLPHDPQVVVGPAFGEDAAAIRLGDSVLAVAADPITFTPHDIGWYAVQVNANDVATMGAKPRWFLASLLLPEGETTPAMAEAAFQQISAACQELGATLIGGHTEITPGLPRVIVAGQMMGVVPPEKLISTAGAQPGDALLMSKGIAIEGTAILARDLAEELLGRGVPQQLVQQAAQFLKRPGLSVVPDCLSLVDALPVHSLHDPTEGGLANALHELAAAAQVGILVDESAIHVYPETAAICQALGLDPMGLIASGALLACVPEVEAERALSIWERQGISGARIGTVIDAPRQVHLRRQSGVMEPVAPFDRDEITKVL